MRNGSGSEFGWPQPLTSIVIIDPINRVFITVILHHKLRRLLRVYITGYMMSINLSEG
jgi:hypothetical protein